MDAEVYRQVLPAKRSTLPYGVTIGLYTAGHCGFYLHGTEVLPHLVRDPRHKGELGYQENLPSDLLQNVNSNVSVLIHIK